MASVAKQWCRSAQRQLRTPTIHPQRLARPLQRSFTSTGVRRAEESDGKSSSDSNSNSSEPYFNQTFFNRLDANDRAAYRGYTSSERRQMEKVEEALRDEFARDSRTHRDLEATVRAELESLDMEFPDPVAERTPFNNGFFQMGEKEDIGPDEDDFQGDDISSTGHGELEQQREIREYARLAGWEMPLLANLAKPFVPPTLATPLRFRYTSYLGELHPAARKVVVEFSPAELSLPEAVQSKLIKLSGPRYNPSTNTIKLSCEAHETQAQNKRYLGDTIKDLIAKAKDPTSAFLDNIPFDFRHAKPKQKLKFPDEWLLTEERKAELEARRAKKAEEELKKIESPLGLIDGVKEIEERRNIDSLKALEQPIMAEARAPLAKGKQDKRAMLRGRA